MAPVAPTARVTVGAGRPIAIDVTPAVRQQAGIGRYSRELARALLARGHEPAEYLVFAADRVTDRAVLDALRLPPDVREPPVRTCTLSARWIEILWHRLGLPLPVQFWTGRLGLFHGTDFLSPPTARAPAIVTVHDLSFLRRPDRAQPGLVDYMARALPRALARASHVLADSASTAADLAELASVDPSRVTIAYPGVDERFRRVVDREALAATRERLGLVRPFVLGVGTIEPRKDWPVLIAAYERLVADGRDLELVIAGRPGWRTAAIEAAARAVPGVRLAGFVADEDLPALYSLAEAFAYPSVYEGFGLPVLEALAIGVPTVTSSSSSLPEVVGEAGLLVPVGDAVALARALARLLTDFDLRRRLQVLGPERAAGFTWSACAAAVEGAYEAARSRRLASRAARRL